MNKIRWVLPGFVLSFASCTLAPSELPADPYLVAIKGVRFPGRSWLPWYTRFADHLWVDVKGLRGWKRVEWNSRTDEVRVRSLDATSATSDNRWGMQVRVVEWFGGPGALPMAEHITKIAKTFPHRSDYQAWPGPNSNTFVAWLARETPGMWVDLPTTAVGKDYATWLRAGVTPTRMGLEFETMLLGVEVGLREGVELQFFGLAVGFGFWPPSIKLPFLPAIPFDLPRRGAHD